MLILITKIFTSIKTPFFLTKHPIGVNEHLRLTSNEIFEHFLENINNHLDLKSIAIYSI